MGVSFMTHELQSAEVKDIAKALMEVQKELQAVTKDAENPFFGSSYASFKECVEVSRPLLVKNNLSIVQTTAYDDQIGTMLVTTILHTSGQWIRGFYPISAVKRDPQAMGSAMTYARRYTYSAIIGLTQADDDGESAMERAVTKTLIDPEETPQEAKKPTLGRLCPDHDVEMVTATSKKGRPYTSHRNDKGEICFGDGKGYRAKRA
jgi:hypothetical protein